MASSAEELEVELRDLIVRTAQLERKMPIIQRRVTKDGHPHNLELTTRGDILRRAATLNERLAIGASARLLQSDGTDPGYVAMSGDATIASGGAVTVAATHSGSAHHTKYTDAEAITAVEGEATLDLAGDVTIDGAKSLKVDVIDEKDAAAGVTVDGVILKDKGIQVPHAGELTINGAGIITVTGGYHTVDTNADASTDNLIGILGGSSGKILYLSPANDGRTVVIFHSTSGAADTISCVGQASITLDDEEDFAILIYSALGYWFAMGGNHIENHASRHAASGADALFSLHTYVFVPDAAQGSDVATGDAQGIHHHSANNDETVLAWYIDAETAPTGAAIKIQLEFGNTDDLDTVASWTEIDIDDLAISAKSVKFTTGFTNATITKNRLIRMNVDQIGSTVAGQDVAVHLLVKRPLST